MIDNHIAGTRLGGRRLSAVRTSEVQAWVTERSQTLSPGTVRLVVQTLRSIFNVAVQDRLLARNPVTRLTLPRSEKQRITPLSVIEVHDLADALPERCRSAAVPWSSPKRASVCESPSYWGYAYGTSTFSGVRCGSNSRRPRTASTEYRPRHQDHDAPSRYRKWSARRCRNVRASNAGRRRRNQARDRRRMDE